MARHVQHRRGCSMRLVLLTLALTGAFFYEYLPPAKRVHLWSDIEGYHYPLLTFAHKSLREGRFPLWDPSIYCGVPLAANIQSGLFYPPNWLLFAANANLPDHLRGSAPPTAGAGMRFLSIEILAIVHVSLAFLFTWWWLRERTSGWLPATLGGTVFACGGYMLSQMNHLGLICGCTWLPFALWGIEQANRTGMMRPLWKVAVAATLCLFAGYPPTLVALATIVLVYAASLHARRRLVPGTAAALVFAGLLGAVQLLPALEAARSKTPDAAFGSALPFGRGLYASLLLPNWFDQNRNESGPEGAEGDYLYLGAPFLFGLGWLARRGWFPGAGPALTLTAVCLFVAADPTGLILKCIESLPFLPDVLRRYNLIPGVVLAAALLAASAADDYLHRGQSGSVPRAVSFLWGAVAILWTLHLVSTDRFPFGAASALYSAATLLLVFAGLWVVRGTRSVFAGSLMVLSVLAEFHAFGTNRRFNAVDGSADRQWRGDARLGGGHLTGLDDAAYREMLQHAGYRVAIIEGPQVTDLRYYGLTSLQGFDPLLTKDYKAAVERFQPFRTNRLFDIDPNDDSMLRFFGVRWLFLRSGTRTEDALREDHRFRMLPGDRSYFSVFEYLHARPQWRFAGDVHLRRWSPEHREFEVQSAAAQDFVLVEQFFPGWEAYLDGARVPLVRADGAFQSAQIPPGRHTVSFRYSPDSLYAGAGVSIVSVALLLYLEVMSKEKALRRGLRDAGLCTGAMVRTAGADRTACSAGHQEPT